MAQEREWEREYARPTFLTRDNKPQADVVRFAKFLRHEQPLKASSGRMTKKFEIDGAQVLDLGCGTGRNAFYFAELGARVTGLEISQTALDIARKNVADANRENNNDMSRTVLDTDSMSKSLFDITYIKQSMAETFPLADESCDIVLDVTSSNSLTEAEREVCLAETARVMKPGAYFFVKALCKDGDENAKHLLKTSPGAEADTYVMPDTHIVERVWTRADFVATYSKLFTILSLEKKTSYTRMNNRVYKRNFWICYAVKK